MKSYPELGTGRFDRIMLNLFSSQEELINLDEAYHFTLFHCLDDIKDFKFPFFTIFIEDDYKDSYLWNFEEGLPTRLHKDYKAEDGYYYSIENVYVVDFEGRMLRFSTIQCLYSAGVFSDLDISLMDRKYTPDNLPPFYTGLPLTTDPNEQFTAGQSSKLDPGEYEMVLGYLERINGKDLLPVRY